MLRKLFAGTVATVMICGSSFVAPAYAADADTLQLSVPRAEQVFLEKNLSLLAQHYNIEAGKALVLQARLWDNPVLNTDQNIYSNHKWFEHSSNPDGSYKGQYYVQLQQLIRTAGKRGKLIDIAATNQEVAEWQFRDLLRNLKYQLRTDLYQARQLQGSAVLYAQELQQLDKLLQGMQAQYQAGNIARKDLLRIQALQISTQQEAAENARSFLDVQAELKTLLQISGDTVIVPGPEIVSSDKSIAPLGELYSQARLNNAAYQLQQLQLQYQQQSLSYQKALAVPDLTLGPNFDKNSNYTTNYVGLGVSFDLPVFNRNQGNIRAARSLVKQAQAGIQLADVQLQNGLNNAYSKWQIARQMNSGTQSEFYTSYGKLYDNIVESYRQRQISLIDFIDYFEAYKEAKLKQLQTQLGLLLAQEDLNYQVGTDVLN